RHTRFSRDWSSDVCSSDLKPLGNELFFQSYGLLEQQGLESIDFSVKKWGDTFGFFSVSNSSGLPFDIFSASFYMITRYEEYLPRSEERRVGKEDIARAFVC